MPAQEPASGPPVRAPATPSVADRVYEPEMLFQAISAVGIDYRYGGKSRTTGFDCSGLVAYVYREAYGIELPPSSAEQARTGQRVEPAKLQAGDLVFFNTEHRPHSHVGIYLGEGRFIHSPRTGAQVRTESMRSPYWRSRMDGARRIVPLTIAADYLTRPKIPAVTYP